LTPVYYTDAGFTQVFTNGDGSTTVYANWGANGYRLPTEAEWEKAARGGLSGQRFPWGDTISESQANYNANPNPPNSGGFAYDLGPYTGDNTNFDSGSVGTSPVGYFAPNGYGLNDMAGNVFEWCWDWYAANPYPAGSPYLGGTDPRGPVEPLSNRVLRGGFWGGYAHIERCAFRSSVKPVGTSFDVGFRCVRGL
jgi:formylglycine-generating enzyme required for sulfatase activity